MKKLPMFAAIVALLAVLAVPAAAGAATSARPVPTGSATAPVNWTGADGSTLTGTFTVTRFAASGGDLTASGTLTGAVTNAVTGATQSVSQALTLDVLQITGSCQILHLELGPLDLDLLGLVIHLDQVVLDITAQQGAGNLLGNLLCGIAGLLDGNSPLNQIANLLNQLLALLR
jgi:hypothetical protein